MSQSIFSLRDCMEYALEHSAKIEIQSADNADARIARRDAILDAFTPTVSGGTYAYWNFGRSVDPETNTYVSTSSFNNGYTISGSIVLFNGFSAVNNIKISKTMLSMGLTKEELLRDEICLSVLEAYCNVLYFSEMHRVMHEQLITEKSNLSLAEKQEQLGQKSRADVVQIEADLADREYQLTMLDNQRRDALLLLKELMFWSPDSLLQIDDTISFLPKIVNSQTPAEHPLVLMAWHRMQNAKTELNTARWRFTPSLSLNGGWSTSYYTYPNMEGYAAKPYFEQFVNNGGEFLQLSLSIPIYDGLSRHSNLSRKKNAYRRAKAEYQQTQYEVKAEITRTTHDRDGAMRALQQADKYAEAQKEAYNINLRKFEQGMLSPLELKISSDNYLKAQAEQLNAQLKYFIKNSVVNYYNGISYIEQL